MANISIAKGTVVPEGLNKIKTLLSESTDETKALLNALEAQGNDISEGLASFPPKLKEVLAPMEEMSDIIDAQIKQVDKLTEQFESLEKLKNCTLNV